MIKIKYNARLVQAGGSVVHIHNNIASRAKFDRASSDKDLMVIKIDDYDKDHEFDVRYTGEADDCASCVVIKLDKEGKVSITKMTELAFLSRKHMQD